MQRSDPPAGSHRRSPPRADRERGDEVAGEDSSDTRVRHFLQARPGGHAVDLEHSRAAVIIKDIHPGKIGPDRRGGVDGELFKFAAGDDSHRPSALLDVGDPARGLSRHTGDYASLRYQEAEVAKAVPTFDPDVALQVIDARHGTGVWNVILAPDQFEAAPL